MLLTGDVSIPRAGMSELPRQLAQELDVTLGVTVTDIHSGPDGVSVQTEAGDTLHAAQVIVATDPNTAARLVGEQPGAPRPIARGSLGSTYLHYAAPEPLERQRRLQLGALPTGQLNQVFWLQEEFPNRVPVGHGLLIVSVWGVPEVDDATLSAQVLDELRPWYGGGVEQLRLLSVDRIPHTQFPQPAGYAATLPGHTTPLPNVFLASEANSLSLEGGEKAAAAILGDLEVLSRPRGA